MAQRVATATITSEKRMPKLLPLIAADCASFTSERTPKKTKRIQNRLPAPRWSNRVYPRNHALFNPRPHLVPAAVQVEKPWCLLHWRWHPMRWRGGCVDEPYTLRVKL